MRGDRRALAAEDHGDLLIALAARDPVQDRHLARGEARALHDVFLELVDPQMRRLRHAMQHRDIGMIDAVGMVGHRDADRGEVLARPEGRENIAVGHAMRARLLDEMQQVARQRLALRDHAVAQRPARPRRQRGEGVEPVEPLAVAAHPRLGKAAEEHVGAPRRVVRGPRIAQRLEPVQPVERACDREDFVHVLGRRDPPHGPVVFHVSCSPRSRFPCARPDTSECHPSGLGATFGKREDGD